MDCIVFPRPISSFTSFSLIYSGLTKVRFGALGRLGKRPLGYHADRSPDDCGLHKPTTQATQFWGSCIKRGEPFQALNLQASEDRRSFCGSLAGPGLVAEQLGPEAFRRRCIRLLHWVQPDGADASTGATACSL